VILTIFPILIVGAPFQLPVAMGVDFVRCCYVERMNDPHICMCFSLNLCLRYILCLESDRVSASLIVNVLFRMAWH